MKLKLPTLNLPQFPFDLKQSKGQTLIKCVVRNKFVVLTPEEWVRQHVVCFFIHNKGVPQSKIAVEKSFQLAERIKRFDAVIYNESIQALLVVECKAPSIKMDQQVLDQVFSYNINLQAPFVFVTNGMTHSIAKIQKETNNVNFLNEVPNYSQLISEQQQS